MFYEKEIHEDLKLSVVWVYRSCDDVLYGLRNRRAGREGVVRAEALYE